MNGLKPWMAAGMLLALLAGSVATGCAGWSRQAKGAGIGAAAGGAVGAVIGSHTGSTARGAIIGAAVGGVAGAIIGRQMDRQAEELAGDLDAQVERAGEGIVVRFANGILFDFDRAELRPEAREELAKLASSLQRYPNTDVLVIGHTDAVGSDDYNQALSERRAQSAVSFLAAQGVAAGRLRGVGRGESEPVASNDTDEGRQLNRRVEVVITASEAYRQQLTGQE